ncbi:unnamed protein product [Urochloa decumbens]|uniref:Uncharacterized protein n=1 Tax=Urochloa decumbens TaxID=240449 RepID=A0ABC9CY08_9POAL
MFFDDSSSDDDDDFEMMAILLAGIAMSKQAKYRGSVPRRKVVRRKLFDYSTDDESMLCAFSSTTASSAAAKKKPLRRLAATADSRLARRPRTRILAGHAGGEIGVPVTNLSAGKAAMTRRQKRKAWMQAKLKVKEVQAGGNSEEKVGTKYGPDPAGSSTRCEAKPNLKYLGPDWVR